MAKRAGFGPCLSDHFRAATRANACGPRKRKPAATGAETTRRELPAGSMPSHFTTPATMARAARGPAAIEPRARRVHVEVIGVTHPPFTEADARRAARVIGAPARGIPPRQLAAGMTAELEHGKRAGRLDVTHDDPVKSARIALAHLREDRAYYKHLSAMEARYQHAPRRAPLQLGPGTYATRREPESELIVSHTPEEGTTIRGNTRPYSQTIKGWRNAWKWWPKGGFWYRQQSRGRAAPSVPLSIWADRLRAAGATVRVESPTIDVEHARGVRAEQLEERAERLETRAQRAGAESAAQAAKVHAIGAHIPFGQPILVGHHSERRHRRDIQRMHTSMGKSVAAHREAEKLQARAERLKREATRSVSDERSRDDFVADTASLVSRRLKRDVPEIQSLRQSGKGVGWVQFWGKLSHLSKGSGTYETFNIWIRREGVSVGHPSRHTPIVPMDDPAAAYIEIRERLQAIRDKAG